MSNHKTKKTFGIIGLGRFGTALAENLAAAGAEVLVLDNNEDKVQHILECVDQAFVVARLDKQSLEESGIQNCDTVIVCIGEQVEASILTTLNVIELGVPRVIAKAISFEHGRVLQKIGAEVVYPERDIGVRLAKMLTNSRSLDQIDFGDDFTISEIKLPSSYKTKTILEANIRKRFSVNILAIVKNGDSIVEVTPDIPLDGGDIIVVVGKKDAIIKFEQTL